MSRPETLGTRLRSLRASRGCSLSELSRRSGIGKGTISELENDRRGARLDTLFALTTALGAPLGALLPSSAPGGGATAAPDGEVRGDAVAAVLLGRWDAGPHLVEVYRVTVTAAGQRSAPHGSGVEETVTVRRRPGPGRRQWRPAGAGPGREPALPGRPAAHLHQPRPPGRGDLADALSATRRRRSP